MQKKTDPMYRYRWANLQTLAITGALAALLLLVGSLVLGRTGMILLGFVGAVSVWRASRMAGNLRPADARELRYPEAPWLFDLVERLCASAPIASTPRIYFSASPMMNAMTFGSRQEPAILVTAGLMNSLSEREVAGVLAHEVAHIQHNDLHLFRLAETVRAMTGFLSNVGWFSLFFFFPVMLMSGVAIPPGFIALLFGAPLVSVLLQLALLRTREYAADARAAVLTGDPLGLASALRTIDQASSSPWRQLFGAAPAEQGGWLRTHPPTGERVRRLMELSPRSAGGHSRAWWHYGEILT
ncbi:MAG: hypothetical protein EA403_10920 [Spirochaetaceae bacterium]|nr:MAG: hypothetical protein EA403_10920 [Spirochaetaceae bacterium]